MWKLSTATILALAAAVEKVEVSHDGDIADANVLLQVKSREGKISDLKLNQAKAKKSDSPSDLFPDVPGDFGGYDEGFVAAAYGDEPYDHGLVDGVFTATMPGTDIGTFDTGSDYTDTSDWDFSQSDDGSSLNQAKAKQKTYPAMTGMMEEFPHDPAMTGMMEYMPTFVEASSTADMYMDPAMYMDAFDSMYENGPAADFEHQNDPMMAPMEENNMPDMPPMDMYMYNDHVAMPETYEPTMGEAVSAYNAPIAPMTLNQQKAKTQQKAGFFGHPEIMAAADFEHHYDPMMAPMEEYHYDPMMAPMEEYNMPPMDMPADMPPMDMYMYNDHVAMPETYEPTMGEGVSAYNAPIAPMTLNQQKAKTQQKAGFFGHPEIMAWADEHADALAMPPMGDFGYHYDPALDATIDPVHPLHATIDPVHPLHDMMPTWDEAVSTGDYMMPTATIDPVHPLHATFDEAVSTADMYMDPYATMDTAAPIAPMALNQQKAKAKSKHDPEFDMGYAAGVESVATQSPSYWEGYDEGMYAEMEGDDMYYDEHYPDMYDPAMPTMDMYYEAMHDPAMPAMPGYDTALPPADNMFGMMPPMDMGNMNNMPAMPPMDFAMGNMNNMPDMPPMDMYMPNDPAAMPAAMPAVEAYNPFMAGGW